MTAVICAALHWHNGMPDRTHTAAAGAVARRGLNTGSLAMMHGRLFLGSMLKPFKISDKVRQAVLL